MGFQQADRPSSCKDPAFLVEQNARMALKFAQRGYVLETGNVVLEGPSEELLATPEVKKAYLGG